MLSVPFLLFGDFSTTAGRLISSNFAEATDAVVLHPADIKLTCASGLGRAIDVWLIHTSFTKLVANSTGINGAPFLAHVTLSF